MLWSRRTCPFGLPDDTDITDNIILSSIGHTLKLATGDVVEAPLPAPLAGLLAQLQQRERRAATAMRRRQTTHPQPVDPLPATTGAVDTQAAL